MYVAFRWLTSLTFAMWLGLCCLDIYLVEYKRSIYLSSPAATYQEISKLNNVSILRVKENKNLTKWNTRHIYVHPGVALQQYVMFLVGVFTVLIYSKKNSLIEYWKNNVERLLQSHEHYLTAAKFKIAALTGVAIHYWNILRRAAINYVSKVRNQYVPSANLSLLKKLEDLTQERKALGRLLMAAIQENKNIRRQYQLEAVIKNRLLEEVQSTQNLMKENRSRYVDFQQLYLVTEKENCFLKLCLKKLKDERDAAEKNLMELINVVYQTKNNDLKKYCTRFIVQTKKNLLNSDVNAEIRTFLQKSNEPMITILSPTEDQSVDLSNEPSSRITEVIDDDDAVSLISNGPRLRGLPGEYMWTVKDKNGLIEKLYEYNCDTDYDHGDTIRRIRQYSVYHDKDCLLDRTNLASNIPTCPSLSASATRIRLDIKSLSSQGFLAKFLKNSSLRLPPTVETLPLSYPTNDL